MASTYENDLRLEEMATGENSGSWGTKTNTNLELIADAFSYGTETIADADTTITIADGAADAARSLALKINSSEDLTTTRVVTLAPNTTSKVWIIENNTSGGQTLTISAGSGSNITLLNGQTKIIATDGIGAGSNVVELTQDIAIADLFVDDDLSLQSDGAIINFGADAEIQLTHVADTGLLLTETGGGAPTLQFRDSALSISSSGDGQLDIDADTEVEITAPTVDISGDLAVDTDTLYVDSANDRVGINGSSPEVALQVHSADINNSFFDGSNATGTQVFIRNSTVASDVYTQLGFAPANDILGGSIVVTSDEDFSVEANRTAHMELKTRHNGNVRPRLYLDENNTIFNEDGRDTDFRIESDTNTHALFVDAGNSRVGILDSNPSHGFTINTATAVKGGSRVNLYTATNENYGYIQNGGASTSNAIILAANGKVLTVDDQYDAKIYNSAGDVTYNWDTSAAIFEIKRANGTFAGTDTTKIDMWHYNDTGNPTGQILVGGTTNYTGDMVFKARGGGTSGTGGAAIYEYLRLRGNERELVVNQDGLDQDFRVESDSQTHALFVDAGNNTVGVGTSSVSSTVAANFHGKGILFRNNVNGDNTNWTRLHNTASTDRSNLLIQPSTGSVEITQGGGLTVANTAGYGTIFNTNGVDADFRVESDSNANAFVVDAGTSIVRIGAGSDVANNSQPKLSITTPWKASSSSDYDGTLSLVATGGGASGGRGSNIIFTGEDGSSARTLAKIDAIKENSTSGDHDGALIFRTRKNGSGLPARLHLLSYEATFNDDSDDTDFRVESDTNANVIFLNAGENRLGLFGSETTTATNYANGVCTKTGIGCYSVSVSNISAGSTSANIDIPFSRIGDGIAEFAFHAHGNGGTTNFGIVAHFYVQENPDRHTRVDVSSQQFTMTSSNSGSNIRITLTNGGSFTSEGGKLLIRKMV